MRRWIFILFLAATLPLRAFDFEVQRPEGYTLFFSVLEADEDNLVEVVSPRQEGSDRWMGYSRPWGELVIPEHVSYEGEEYTVVAIGDRAFYGCDEVTALRLPSSLTEIGDFAFYQCRGIRGEVTIGERVTRVGQSAFYGCTLVKTLNFNAEKCEFMGGSRSTSAFGSCPSLSQLNFGPRVTRIPDYAFTGMELKCDWQLPQSLVYVGEYAFAYCNDIRGALRLPQGLKNVSACAFAQCHSITSIELPPHLVQIGRRAFYQCVGVKSVKVQSFEPPVLEEDAFAGLDRRVEYNVPCVSVDRYRASEAWAALRNIKTSYPCKVDVVTRATLPHGATVTGGGNYSAGSRVQLTVLCKAGYGFRGWADGNVDNPRTVVAGDTLTYVAIIQPAEVVYEVEYVHDTIWSEGQKVIVEYYEINDVAEPMGLQSEIVYNKDRRRLEIPVDKADLTGVSLYNESGQCVFTGKPRKGIVKMKRFPTGTYYVRVTTLDEEAYLRFFHVKKR